MRGLAVLCALGLWVALVTFLQAEEVDLDRFDLEQISEHEAVLIYHNSASMSSIDHPHRMQGDRFFIRLRLQITPEDEILTVIPSDGWIAIPETVSVPDGDTARVRIIEYTGF